MMIWYWRDRAQWFERVEVELSSSGLWGSEYFCYVVNKASIEQWQENKLDLSLNPTDCGFKANQLVTK